jgi:hypothetical protein
MLLNNLQIEPVYPKSGIKARRLVPLRRITPSRRAGRGNGKGFLLECRDFLKIFV